MSGPRKVRRRSPAPVAVAGPETCPACGSTNLEVCRTLGHVYPVKPMVAPITGLRAALYARVSTRDKGQTTANQLPVLKAFARENGWEVVATFEDQESGGTSGREGFQAMLAAGKRRDYDVLVFWSLDRFSREGSYATLDYLQQLSGWGVRFKSYTEQYLDTCGIFKDAIIALLAALAKQEQLRLRERVKAGIERARAQGKRLGRGDRVEIDMDRFRRLDAVYSVPELMKLLQIGRTTVYDLRKRAAAEALAERDKDEGTA